MRTANHGLLSLRLFFAAFPLALLLLLYVLDVIVSDSPSGRAPSWIAWGLGALGLGALAGVSWARNRPLTVSDEAALAASYRTALFSGIAFAESTALAGFALVFITGDLWLYLEGLGFGLVGLAMIAPTGRDLERRQQQITAQGSTLSLVEALRNTPPGRPGR